MTYRLLSTAIAALIASAVSAAEFPAPIVSYPTTLDGACREGKARLYDECGDQAPILQQALAAAQASGKSVLVVFGAEWCIWCHVFSQYVNGQTRRFEYRFEVKNEIKEVIHEEHDNDEAEAQAEALNRFVAEHFVIAHIEGDYAPNGVEVVNSTGVEGGKITYVPFIFSLDGEGRYAARMRNSEELIDLEVLEDSGEEYHGYNREVLLEELTRLRKAAQAG